MSTARATMTGLMIGIVLLAAPAWAQGPLTATLHESGMIEVTGNGTQIATIDLNAHGPNWQHAPQQTATGQITDLSSATEKRVEGTLPIPNTEGGALEFTETVTALPQGLRLEYEVSASQTMRVYGLQLSVNLPVATHGGAEVMVLQPHVDPEIAGLPSEHTEGRSQLWSGSGATVKVADGTDHAVTIELRAATDVIIQDLREWEHDVFEVRFPAIMEGGGYELTAHDRFHLDLTITFAGPLSLQAG